MNLTEALRAAGLREVDDSPRRLAEYSSDASNYRVRPAAVVFPRHTDEVLAALEVCRVEGVPLTARGAGTSIAGNAIGTGVVLDFSRHLHRVHEIDPEARTARVDPGVVLDALSAASAPHGLRFGPDPSTHSRATIGGSLGNNACGSRALRYGRCSDNVVQLDLVTGRGTRLTAKAYGRAGLGGQGLSEVDRLDELVTSNLALIRTEFGRFVRQVSGYSMEHLLPEHGADLARFLVGTEGTLGIVLGATVRLVSSPAATALVVLGYPDMAAAADDAPALLAHRPVALEGIDARLVDMFRQRGRAAAVPDLPAGSGWLFVEVEGGSPAEAGDAARRLLADAGCLDGAVFTGAAATALWRIREDGAGLGGRTPGNHAAWPGWEDSAVPPARLGPYLRDLTDLMAGHDVDGLLYGHFGDGCVHARYDFPLRDRPDAFRAFVEAAADLVASYGGSMSGEHGDGRARSELLGRMYSPAAIDLFAGVKDAFDPDDILNPGVVVRPSPLDHDLRLHGLPVVRLTGGFAHRGDDNDLASAVHRCTGVGKCRSDLTAAGGVMCPSYLATRDEKDSTRGRARVLQDAVAGRVAWDGPEVAESLDLCLSCKGCARDCPTGIDMATYKSEALHERYRGRLRPRAHYALGRLPTWLRLASRAPGAANRMVRLPGVAAIAKRVAGIDRRRALPSFARKTFRAWFTGRTPTPERTGNEVLLWVDTFTEYLMPEVGLAAVRVLEQAGYTVRILEQPVCCGLTWISTGQLDAARKRLSATLSALDDAVRRAVPIVGLEPSCTAVLREDLPGLLPDDPRAARVAATTVSLAELLARTPGWTAPDLSGVTAVAQPHCHHRAVLGWDTDAALLRDAKVDVTAVGGCCGLAGNFGFEQGHYDVSVAVAENALLPALRARPDAAVLADGYSCRTQVEQLDGRRARHLAELLAERLDP